MAHDDGTEYTSHVDGDMKCATCEHFVAYENGCNGKHMKDMSSRPRLKDGNVKVAPSAWCRFYDIDLIKLRGEPECPSPA